VIRKVAELEKNLLEIKKFVKEGLAKNYKDAIL